MTQFNIRFNTAVSVLVLIHLGYDGFPLDGRCYRASLRSRSPVVSEEKRVFKLHASSDLLSEGGVHAPVPGMRRLMREAHDSGFLRRMRSKSSVLHLLRGGLALLTVLRRSRPLRRPRPLRLGRKCFMCELSKDCGCRVAQLMNPPPPSPGYPAGEDRSQICSSGGATQRVESCIDEISNDSVVQFLIVNAGP